jgi:hypothetical protein
MRRANPPSPLQPNACPEGAGIVVLKNKFKNISACPNSVFGSIETWPIKGASPQPLKYSQIFSNILK